MIVELPVDKLQVKKLNVSIENNKKKNY